MCLFTNFIVCICNFLTWLFILQILIRQGFKRCKHLQNIAWKKMFKNTLTIRNNWRSVPETKYQNLIQKSLLNCSLKLEGSLLVYILEMCSCNRIILAIKEYNKKKCLKKYGV